MDSRREEVLFVSNSHRSWPEVLQDYAHLLDQTTQPTKMPVAEYAFAPCFALGWLYIMMLAHDWIMHNARFAPDLDFRTWITDDG